MGDQSTDISNSKSTMILVKYTEADTIILKCTLYNNPIYRQVVTGFEISITDNEALPNDILTSPEFQLDKSGATDLTSVVMDNGAIDFAFYLELSDTEP